MRVLFCKKCGRTQIQSNGNGLERCGCGSDEYTDQKPATQVPVLAEEYKRSLTREVAPKPWSLSEYDGRFLKSLRIGRD